MKDAIGNEINIGDIVILQLTTGGNKRYSTSKLAIGKVVRFTEKLVVLQYKHIDTGHLKNNMLDSNYEPNLIKRYPNNIIIYSDQQTGETASPTC